MAPFDGNIVKRLALIIVFLCMYTNSCVGQTDLSIACNSDPEACRSDCPAEVVQKHNCTSEEVVLGVVDGKCCPGYYRTRNNKCQVCHDGSFMPDVNNCSECLPCGECDNKTNDFIETLCSITTNTVCNITKDPTCPAPSDCPWIKTSSAAPTTQVPTTEAVSVNNTPSDPQEGKSYKGEFYGFMVLSIILVVMILLICSCLCYAYHSGGTDQTDGKDKTWKEVARIVAEKIRRPRCAGRPPATPAGGQPAPAPGGQPAAPPGGRPATPPGGRPATPPGGRPATPPGGRPATPPGGRPATPPGSGDQVASQVQCFNNIGDNNGADEPDGPNGPDEPNEYDPLNSFKVV